MAKDPTRTVVAAPFSYAGITARTLNLVWHDRPPVVKVLGALFVIPTFLPAAYVFLVGWYLIFGLSLAPYRLLRRGSRKRKREARMHKETLQAIREQGQQKPD